MGWVVKVAIIAVESEGEAQLLRLQLENLGFAVCLRRVMRPTTFLASFDFFGQPADVAIVCARGDPAGLVFPALPPGSDTLVLPGDRMGAEILAGHLREMPPVVVMTGAETGRKDFARAFLAAGAKAYVAPDLDPDPASALVLVTLAAYRVASAGTSWEAAVRTANNFFTLENRWSVWR